METRFVAASNDASGNDGTKLFGALEQALKDVPPERVGGALLVTDGVVHDIPAKAEALGFHAPVHALITGREGERDRRIELVEAPRFGIVGKEQTVRARVVDTGGDGARAPITVRRDGEQLPTYSPVPGDIVNIPVKITHGGANIVELEVPPAPGEITLADNKAVLTIEGVRDRLKVLLVSGEPHPGERAWRNLLRADANVELVHFTILRPPEKLDVTPASELVADRFSDRRSLRAQDQRIRSHHLRPLFEPDAAALRLFRQYRALRRERRRLSGGCRAGLRLDAGSLLLAARKHAAGAARRVAL